MEDEPAARLVDALLRRAQAEDADGIELGLAVEGIRAWLRVGEELLPAGCTSPELWGPLLRHLKRMGALDPQRDIPEEGALLVDDARMAAAGWLRGEGERVKIRFNRSRRASERDWLASENPHADILEGIVLQALAMRAVDIHIGVERDGGQTPVRLRIDGELRNLTPLPHGIRVEMIQRVKVMCGMDLGEEHLPQEGRLCFQTPDGEAHFRAVLMPGSGSERLVLRQEREAPAPALDSLGMAAEVLAGVREVIGARRGLILAVGPCGTGKTTAIAAMLSAIDPRKRRIMTIEDPIEYPIPGALQFGVNPCIGLSVGTGLHCIARHSPDVAVAAEIRDIQTAETAVDLARSSLGLAAMSVSSVNAHGRLLDMGLPVAAVADSILAVLATRLVRVLCTRCRSPLRAQRARCRGDAARRGWEPGGCSHCHGTGYYGRTGVHELLVMDAPRRECIRRGKPVLLPAGRSLREDALRKVEQGVTSLAEVERVA